jgi:Ca2+-binding EF-hand superfamily protein
MKFSFLSSLTAGASVLAISGFLFFSAAGCAHHSKPSSEKRLEALFRQADTDGDGRVSRMEFTSLMLEEAFVWMDGNQNGRISEQEFLASGGTSEQFRSLDRGNKGYFTVEDAKANPAARRMMALPFDGADPNGDGYVTWQEFQDYRARAAAYIN